MDREAQRLRRPPNGAFRGRGMGKALGRPLGQAPAAVAGTPNRKRAIVSVRNA